MRTLVGTGAINVADVGVVDGISVATVVVVWGGTVAIVAGLMILGEVAVRRVQVAPIGVHNTVNNVGIF